MTESTPLPANPPFKDRRGGLIGFGILMIIVGCLCALLVPMIFLGQAMSAQAARTTPDYRMIIPGALIYAGLAVAFIWLGFGSIMARRWARALLLIIGWCWLLTGVLSLGLMAVLLPKIFANPPPGGQPLPHAMLVSMMIFMVGFMGLVFVILPGLLVLFYRSPHVKATCEARDPVTRWTDGCPLPVLALSLLLCFGVLSLLPVLLAYHSVAPFFGRLVSGAPGTVLLLAMMALWSYCAWAIYRLKTAGWWTLLIGFGVLMISAAVTFARVDLIAMYRLMGYPEQQIAMMQQYNFFNGRPLLLLMLGGCVPFGGYLLWVKRFFRRAAESCQT